MTGSTCRILQGISREIGFNIPNRVVPRQWIPESIKLLPSLYHGRPGTIYLKLNVRQSPFVTLANTSYISLPISHALFELLLKYCWHKQCNMLNEYYWVSNKAEAEREAVEGKSPISEFQAIHHSCETFCMLIMLWSPSVHTLPWPFQRRKPKALERNSQVLTFLIISMKKILVFLHSIFVTWSLVQFSSDDISNLFFLSPLTLYFGPHPYPQLLT